MTKNTDYKRVFISGTAGFIGFHLAKLLLEQGYKVKGYDALTDYYDVDLKNKRNQILFQYPNYSFQKGRLENDKLLSDSITSFQPDCVVHLAAQAGVRHSLKYPQEYISTNVQGSFNIIEACRASKVKHMMIASTSSVYGTNEKFPFQETDKADTPMTIYSATKKSSENIAHSYSHLWKIPTTIFRFFTVYGPWGRPDMALFKFTDAIKKDKPIDLYNNGEMYRDFTFVEDLVQSISLLMVTPPTNAQINNEVGTTNSNSAPFRVVNIGSGKSIPLHHYVEELERCLGKKATKNMLPMQKGDVPSSLADNSVLKEITGYVPQTPIKDGIKQFVDWHNQYYG